MSDDPRQEAAIEWLTKRFYTEEAARMVAPTLLAAIDAKDPLRRPPGDEAVRAFLYAYDGALGHRGQKAMGGLIAALAVMRGEAVTEFTSRTIDGVPTRVRYTEANPPPDAIEDRLAALEARPQWTTEKNRLLRHIAQIVFSERKRHEDYIETGALIDAAFESAPDPRPEWLSAKCLKWRECKKYSSCLARTFICPHAGERA